MHLVQQVKEGKLSLTDWSDDELLASIREHGGQRAAARALGVAQSTLSEQLRRRGLSDRVVPKRLRLQGNLTRELVAEAMLPPNNCPVKRFLELIADDEQRELVETALAYDKRDLSGPALRDMLIKAGYPTEQVPGVDAINSHRTGMRPCRCKG